MRGWERVEVRGGWVTFGKDLAMRADLVQRVDVTRGAVRPNKPAEEDPLGVAGSTQLYRVEVKDAARAAPFVVFEGNERECRRRLTVLVEGLRGAAVPWVTGETVEGS